MNSNQATQTGNDLSEYRTAVERLAEFLKTIEGQPLTDEKRDQLKALQVAERMAKKQHKEGLADDFD
ncbi:MAG TPA: hypothetical protein VMT88_10485 [Actinomycetes bacterium]|nr:hypothetical protein [Actinomycetes bacterium]